MSNTTEQQPQTQQEQTHERGPASGYSSDEIELIAKHGGQQYLLRVPADATILDLKHSLQAYTNVLPKRQKIVGLYKGKTADDEMTLKSLNVKPNTKFMMIGTPEEKIAKDPKDMGDLPEVLNDLDYDYFPDSEEVKNNEENKRKLKKRIETVTINFINEPRKGKKLLVLDIDYTIFDCKSTAENITVLMRPYLEEFLISAYQDYDLVFWSQTSWRWLEAKLTEMGILQHPDFKVAFVMDRTTMFSITTKDDHGQPKTHEVKALQIIWEKVPEFYNSKNTIHIDDLGRNFAMNPQNGLKIKAFKNAPTTRDNDRELYYLAKYLKHIAKLDDLSTLKHKDWKKVVEDLENNK